MGDLRRYPPLPPPPSPHPHVHVFIHVCAHASKTGPRGPRTSLAGGRMGRQHTGAAHKNSVCVGMPGTKHKSGWRMLQRAAMPLCPVVRHHADWLRIPLAHDPRRCTLCVGWPRLQLWHLGW